MRERTPFVQHPRKRWNYTSKGVLVKGVLVKGVLGCHSSTKTSIILFLIGPIGHTRLLLAEGIGHISLLCPKVAACLHHVMVT